MGGADQQHGDEHCCLYCRWCDTLETSSGRAINVCVSEQGDFLQECMLVFGGADCEGWQPVEWLHCEDETEVGTD